MSPFSTPPRRRSYCVLGCKIFFRQLLPYPVNGEKSPSTKLFKNPRVYREFHYPPIASPHPPSLGSAPTTTVSSRPEASHRSRKQRGSFDAKVDGRAFSSCYAFAIFNHARERHSASPASHHLNKHRHHLRSLYRTPHDSDRVGRNRIDSSARPPDDWVLACARILCTVAAVTARHSHLAAHRCDCGCPAPPEITTSLAHIDQSYRVGSSVADCSFSTWCLLATCLYRKVRREC